MEIKSLGMGIAMACITTLALTSLYESIQILEDPFVAFVVLDGVSIHDELLLHARQLLIAREEIFPDAPPYIPPESHALTSVENVTDKKVPAPRGGRNGSVLETHERNAGMGTKQRGLRGSTFFHTTGDRKSVV